MPTAALRQTLDAIEVRGWLVVLLQPRSKRPAGVTWNMTRDPGRIEAHVTRGGNIGLVCGPDSGVAVPDFDQIEAARALFQKLGPLAAWVESRPGRSHSYVRWEPGLPAKLRWQGQIVGELQRGSERVGVLSHQQVVLPPSIHPETGHPYRWLVDPTKEPLLALPASWKSHLGKETEKPQDAAARRRPASVSMAADNCTDSALRQPGARRRRNGVKFQCPACRDEGRDRHQDNAIAFDSGGWGCAVGGRSHWRPIGLALGQLRPATISTTRERVPWQ
jgi:hypothetical protein